MAQPAAEPTSNTFLVDTLAFAPLFETFDPASMEAANAKRKVPFVRMRIHCPSFIVIALLWTVLTVFTFPLSSIVLSRRSGDLYWPPPFRERRWRAKGGTSLDYRQDATMSYPTSMDEDSRRCLMSGGGTLHRQMGCIPRTDSSRKPVETRVARIVEHPSATGSIFCGSAKSTDAREDE